MLHDSLDPVPSVGGVVLDVLPSVELLVPPCAVVHFVLGSLAVVAYKLVAWRCCALLRPFVRGG